MFINAKQTLSLPDGVSDFSELGVRVRIENTSVPARVYTYSGALLNNQGLVDLSSDGVMDVWLSANADYRFELYNKTTGVTYWRQESNLPIREVTAPSGPSDGGAGSYDGVAQNMQAVVGKNFYLSIADLPEGSDGITYAVDWGDESSTNGSNMGAGPVLLAHMYSSSGSYTISWSRTVGGKTVQGKTYVSVADAPVTAVNTDGVLAADFGVIQGDGPFATGEPTALGIWTVSGPAAVGAERQEDSSGIFVTNTVDNNTYLFMETGSKPIRRMVVKWSGTTGQFPTLAYMLNNSLQDMVHVNFGTGNPSADVRLWKTGEGASLPVALGVNIRQAPTLDDGEPHWFALEIRGSSVFVFVDNVLVYMASDPRFVDVHGNTAMTQLHGLGEKVYGMWLYVEDEESTKLENVRKTLIADLYDLGGPWRSAGLMVSSDPAAPQLNMFDIRQGENDIAMIRCTHKARMMMQAQWGYSAGIGFGLDGSEEPGYKDGNSIEFTTGLIGFNWKVNGEDLLQLSHGAVAEPLVYGVRGFGIGPANNATPRLLQGTGSPEGVVAAPPGSIYTDKTPTTGSLYRKKTGTTATGWVKVPDQA